MTVTHWTFDEIDALPFPQVLKQLEYWAENPPAHELLKGFVGYKGAAGKPSRRGELNRWDREAMPPSSASLPTPPPYVLEAMKKHKPEPVRG